MSQAYAEKFQLKPLIRFHHEVVTLERPSDKAGWIVKLRDSVSKRNLADRHFDYVLIAKGQVIPSGQYARGITYY
jgi:cation diffusion facilitator CzcD-associated flavoprotein CzcO